MLYGIWNSWRKEFQFGIAEPTKKRALHELFRKISHDARKWRFEVRQLPKELWK